MSAKTIMPILAALGCAAFLPACAERYGESPSAASAAMVPAAPQRATAELRDAQNRRIGTVTLTAAPHGLLIDLEAADLPPGTHGVHLHEVGACEPAGFQSAKGHVGMSGRKHGLLHPDGPEAGDLPNVFAGADGRVRAQMFTTLVTLGAGPNSLLDADGSAIVIHAAADDQMTQPIGNSGARIACGVIRGS